MRQIRFVLLLALTLALAMHSTPLEGQPRVTPQLALARICASEAGLRVTDDCAAIYAVLSRNGASSAFLSRARSYSSRVFDLGRNDPRAWIAHLDPSGAQPTGWPTATRPEMSDSGQVRYRRPPPWSRYRQAWLDLYAHAGRIIRGEVAHECAEPPQDWGGDMDTARYLARLPNARRVDCGQTLNNFWIRR